MDAGYQSSDVSAVTRHHNVILAMMLRKWAVNIGFSITWVQLQNEGSGKSSALQYIWNRVSFSTQPVFVMLQEPPDY